jgi:folate-binding protein YgfZ
MTDSNMDALGSYQELTQDAGYVELHDWNIVSLTGRDRHQLLHNFCTANVKQLPAGHCTEAFILNEKGKTLWFGQIIALDDQLLLCGASPFGDRIRAHLIRYVIREDVQVIDSSSELRAAFVSGAEATAKLHSGLGVSLPNANQSIRTETSVGQLVIANLEVANWGYLLIHATNPGLVTDWLANLSISSCDRASLERLRMENVTPWYGFDVDESNLPQEVNRDAKAISFTKGCYLGQETVARLDALGHVNQLLVGLKFETNPPPLSGLVIEQAGKKILRVTSTAKSDTGTIGMGYVRRELAVSGTEIPYRDGVIRVA